MPVEILMPALSPTMTEGKLLSKKIRLPSNKSGVDNTRSTTAKIAVFVEIENPTMVQKIATMINIILDLAYALAKYNPAKTTIKADISLPA